jgi:hypothetical protein
MWKRKKIERIELNSKIDREKRSTIRCASVSTEGMLVKKGSVEIETKRSIRMMK